MHSSRPPVRLLITCFVIFFAAATLHAGPRPGEILIGEDEKNYYYMQKEDYIRSGAKKFAEDWNRAKLAVAADQNAIRGLGLELDANKFEKYAAIAEREKKSLEDNIYGTLFDQGLEALGLAFASAKSLNPWNVNTNKAVVFLKEHGYRDSAIIDALRTIAMQKDKPAMEKAYREFKELAKAAKLGWDTGRDIARNPNDAEFKLLVAAIKIAATGQPEVGATITGLEFGKNLAYLGYVSKNLADLTAISDKKLAALPNLTALLKEHVRQMSEAKKAWQKVTKYPTAAPILTH